MQPISSADIDVIHSIGSHFSSLKATYQRETEVKNKRILLEHANRIYGASKPKAPEKQQQQVLASLALFQSNMCIQHEAFYPQIARKKMQYEPRHYWQITFIVNQHLYWFNWFHCWSTLASTPSYTLWLNV